MNFEESEEAQAEILQTTTGTKVFIETARADPSKVPKAALTKKLWSSWMMRNILISWIMTYLKMWYSTHWMLHQFHLMPDSKQKKNFHQKCLSVGTSEKGISVPFIGKVRGPAVEGDIYIKNYLMKLDAFNKKHQHNDWYIFWLAPMWAANMHTQMSSSWRPKIYLCANGCRPTKCAKSKNHQRFPGNTGPESKLSMVGT